MPSAIARSPSANSRPPASAPEGGGLGLYIHWPFCQSLCPYCDFNSHVRTGIDEARWIAACIAELTHYARRRPGRRIDSIFIGGGTPSLLAARSVGALLDAVARLWPVAGDAEITMEANPGSAGAGRFAGYRAAGVNRISLGVQALDDRALRALGRTHDAAAARHAAGLAARLFPRHSIDLIYARPGQTAAAWRQELTEALGLAGGHVSAYQLTIEPGTVFAGAARRGSLVLPPEDEAVALFEVTRAVLDDAGLPAYEISSHARPGEACRHNLVYWQYGDYIGVGPGAHGRLAGDGGVRALRQHRAPEIWLRQVEATGHATRRDALLDRQTVRDEMVMMGLRLTRGVSRAAFRDLLRQEPEAILPRPGLDRLIDGGFLQLDATGLRATARGRRRLDAVLAALLA